MVAKIDRVRMRLAAAETVAKASERTGGRSRGFDYLRLLLAAGVICWHSFQLNDRSLAIQGWYRPLVGLILPMFFALSGYLVSGSLVRVKSIHEFITLRAIRIVPALAVETVLSMLVIGAIFTSLPLGRYFTDRDTFSYALNIVGDIHYLLPGVFRENQLPHVNAPLWTIPFELECYLGIVVLWLCRAIRKPRFILAVIMFLQIAIPIWEMSRHGVPGGGGTVAGRVLFLSFLCGIAIYDYQKAIVLRPLYFGAALTICVLMLTNSAASYFVAIPASYVTVYLGLRNPPRIPLLMAGDFSYGLYLYGFPIQQAVYASVPAHRHWWFNLPLSLLLAGFFAAFSWYAVEMPVLKSRKLIIGAVDRFTARLMGNTWIMRPIPNSPIDAKIGAERE